MAGIYQYHQPSHTGRSGDLRPVWLRHRSIPARRARDPAPPASGFGRRRDNLPYPIGIPKISVYEEPRDAAPVTRALARRPASRRESWPGRGRAWQVSPGPMRSAQPPPARLACPAPPIGPGLTRRDLLWRGAAGAGLLAAGPVLAACSSGTATSSASASASAGTPKRGGTLNFARSVGADPARPGQLDRRRRRLHPGQDLRAALHHQPGRPAGALAGAGPHRQHGRQDLDVRAAPGGEVLRRHAAHRRRRGVLDQAGGGRRQRAAQLPRLRDQVAQGRRRELPWWPRSCQPWAPFLSDISVFANAIMPTNFGGKTASAFFANPVGTGPFTLKSFVKGGNV